MIKIVNPYIHNNILLDKFNVNEVSDIIFILFSSIYVNGSRLWSQIFQNLHWRFCFIFKNCLKILTTTVCLFVFLFVCPFFCLSLFVVVRHWQWIALVFPKPNYHFVQINYLLIAFIFIFGFNNQKEPHIPIKSAVFLFGSYLTYKNRALMQSKHSVQIYNNK